MRDSDFSVVETAIVNEIRPMEKVEVRYFLTEDGMEVIGRSESPGPNADVPEEIGARLEAGEKLRLIRNQWNNSGLSLQDFLLLEQFPGVLDIVVVTPSGSNYRASTHEFHAENNRLRMWKNTIMRLSADLSLLITPSSVDNPELRLLADRMPRHYLAQHLYGLGALEYHAWQAPEDAIIVAAIYDTPLRQKWLTALKEIH